MAAISDHAGEVPHMLGPALAPGGIEVDVSKDEGKDEEAQQEMSANKTDSFQVHGEKQGVTITPRAWVGFCAQYFSVGVIYGGLPATIYGVFLGYLNVPGYVLSTVSVIMMLPWSFKFLFGLINDTVPIWGMRRKPYMVLGWALCAVMLVVLAYTPLPKPYWCVDEVTGEYMMKDPATGHAMKPCNPEAAHKGGKYAILLMLAALGYVIADVAADGLTVEYAKAEPIHKRGSTQTTAYLTRTLGQAVATLFVGVCMNSKLYTGDWEWGLSFNQVCLAFAIPPVLMVPISAIFVVEPAEKERVKMCDYLGMCWNLLKSKAFFYIVIYCFFTNAVGSISTTAGPQVKRYWAEVGNLQDKMFSLFGNLLFAAGLWLVKKRFLSSSWRGMLIITTVFLQIIDFFFSTLTIFDVVRNQYFYLGETVLIEVPAAANFVVSTFVIVEMADNGNEGMVYGLLTTTSNLGSPFARAIGNQVYQVFQPSISESTNYIKDTPEFRHTVFASFLVSYGFTFASLGFLYFLPDQKQQAQERKQKWNKRRLYGVMTLAMLSIALVYSLVVNFLSMDESTMCLKFAGGDGCDTTTATNPGTNSTLGPR